MSLLTRIVKNRTTEESFTNYRIPVSGARRGGTDVSRASAMQQATVWACVRLRAETIGMLPFQVVEYQGANRIPVENPTWLERPNPEMTSFDLFERTSASIDIDGNSFWWKEFDNLGRLREVWPLPPAKVSLFRNEEDEKRFRIQGDREDYGSDRILHIPGFTLPGRMRGLSPIEQHATSIGLAIATEQHGEAYFSNGSIMSGVIESPNDPGDIAAKRMQASFERDHRGVRNAHRPGFLFGGAKWVQLTIPNDAAQFLETRKYQRSDIASIFRVPPHKIGDLEHATFSNIEHQAIEWVQDGVLPYTTRIERAVVADGMLDRGQRLKFNMAGLLRGDTKSMYDAFAIGRQWGWLSVDDIRAMIDQNPLPDGKGEAYLEPLNMKVAGAEQPLSLEAKVNAAGALVRAGFDPAEALQTVGLDPIAHLGLLPVTLQSANQLELSPAEAQELT